MNDEKVISSAIESFENALPGENVYIVLKKQEQCRYVKIDSPYIHYVQYGSSDFWACVSDIDKYKYILLHSLSYNAAKFINQIEHPRIVWLIWGYDLYNNILIRKGFRLYDRPMKVLLYSLCQNPIREVRTRLMVFRHYLIDMKVLKKISFLSTFPLCDVEILRKYLPETENIPYKLFFYYPIDKIVDSIQVNCTELGENIIVGNSASFTNNHERIFCLLSKYNNLNRTVIAPLSYGAAKQYALHKGKKYCGDCFKPITDFLPLYKYNEILKSSYTFIYGQYRQEAFGNIITALYIGGTVFMFECNPLYKSLIDLGFILFNLEQLDRFINYRLSTEEKNNNYYLAIKYFDIDYQLSLIKENFQ